MNKFRIKTNGEIMADDVLLNNGYIKKDITETFPKWKIAKDFIVNNGGVFRNHCFVKDGGIVIFSNWEGDENNMMIKNPEYIEVYDVSQVKILML